MFSAFEQPALTLFHEYPYASKKTARPSYEIMGSAIWPSCDEPAQRLSKPRTNTSSSNLLTLASQQSEASSPRSPDSSMFSEDHVVTSQTGDRRSRRKSRSKIRSYLHGSGNDSPRRSSSDDEDDGQRGIVKDVRKRISRRSSSLSRLSYCRRSSTQLASNTSSRLKLNDDESTRMEQEIKEKEYTDRVAAQNHVPLSADVNQQNNGMRSPLCTKSPIRRKSLYTPGLATRTPHDILRRPPMPDVRDSELEREYYYNPSRPQSSPLSDLAALAASRNAALASSKDGRSTPIHLAQLGGLVLGTLRITNGTASPEPSDAMSHIENRRGSDSASHEEFCTASEGYNSEDEALSISSRSVIEMTRPPRRTGSPLKFESRWKEESRAPSSHVLNGAGDYSEAENMTHTETGMNCTNITPKASDRASSMAQDYMMELPPSPYKPKKGTQDNARNPNGTNTSTRPFETIEWNQDSSTSIYDSTDFQDEGVDLVEPQRPVTNRWRSFVDEAEARHAGSNTKEDAYRILNGEVSPRNSMVEQANQYLDIVSGDRDDRRASTTTTNTTYSGSTESEQTKDFGTITVSETRYRDPDSGYNSNASLNVAGHEDNAGSPQRGFLRGYPKDHRSISGPRDMPQSTLRGSEAYPCASVAPRRPALNVAARPVTTVTVTTVSSPILQRQASAPPGELPCNRIGTSAAAAPQLPAVVPSVETSCRYSKTSPLGLDTTQQQVKSTQSSPKKPRKLQKPRRSSKLAPVDKITVQQLRELTETTIPAIPASVASKYAERVFPLRERTFTSSLHTNSDDSREPSPERIAMPIRFPSPANSIEERNNAIVNGDLDWPTKSSKKKAKESKKEQLSRARRKSQCEPVPSIADFGDIASILGRGPYDAAMAGSDTESRGSSDRSRRHPHQISTNMARPKSMFAGSEQTRDYDESHRRRAQSISRPQTPGSTSYFGSQPTYHESVRPQSMFVNAPVLQSPVGEDPFSQQQGLEVGSTIGNRPFSMFADVPPVPSLPSPNRAKKLESKARKARPSESPSIPNVPSPGNQERSTRSSDRPRVQSRPRSMCDASPTRMQPLRAQTYAEPHDTHNTITNARGRLDILPVERHPSPNLERSETVIYHGSSAFGSARPQTMYADIPAMPAASATASSQRHSKHFIDELNSKHASAPSSKAVGPWPTHSAQNGERGDALQPTDGSSVGFNFQKKRPGGGKPDIWKSDSLRQELNKRSPNAEQETTALTSNSDDSEIPSELSSIWDTSKLSWAQRKQSAAAALSANGFTVGQVAKPIGAPSIHDALRRQRDGRSRASTGPHEGAVPPSSSGTSYGPVRSQAASCVKPPVFTHDHIPGITPQQPTRSAPRSPPKSSHDTPAATERPTSSYFPRAEPYTPKKSSKNNSPTDSGSPRTPRSGRKSSKQNSPTKQPSLTISSPTANAADSYNSHADAAPAPPSFSVSRKRVSSAPSYMAIPSARSLKPTPVSPPSPSAATSTIDLNRTENSLHTGPLTCLPLPGPSTMSLAPSMINPLASNPSSSAVTFSHQAPPSNYAHQPFASSTQTLARAPHNPPTRFANISGRYQGGLQYGYEPGIGLGGSAGTRAAKNGAARKSVDVSKGFGLDLSDVPIFVSPTNR